MECSISGCIRGVFAKGLCSQHYSYERRACAAPCSHDGCERPASKRGLCEPHYRKARASMAEPCSISGCARPVVTAGLCDAHRKRKDRHGHLDPTRPADWGGRRGHPLYGTWQWHMRHKHRGNFCARWHDFWVFAADVGERPTPTHKLKRLRSSEPYGPNNFHWYDPPLPFLDDVTGKFRAAKWQSQYRQRHPERVRSYRFKAAYGITVEQYREMEAAQDGLCAICGKPEAVLHKTTLEPRQLAVDHCHKTGKVRALLCSSCNGGLGNFRDDTTLLERAITYLRQHTLPTAE